ncbi:PQQ-dependent sugar dehydrogenase [Microbispora amethystogenes]|uniref:PQQ-dependent sugar dehydrogenase n=1 Tax=Microbispora amethystogenes TaxID=1427754 RepID=UPI001EF1F5A8|nr:PQQ-dependent sugar dehydrogenase [Microbispora amethystogenes]
MKVSRAHVEEGRVRAGRRCAGKPAAFLPDGTALVTERATANIMRVTPGATPVRVTTVRNVSVTGDGGLLGIARSPAFPQDLFVYVYLTTASDNRVVRFRWNYPDAQQVVLSGIPRAQTRNGGRIAFGPDGSTPPSSARTPGTSSTPSSRAATTAGRPARARAARRVCATRS